MRPARQACLHIVVLGEAAGVIWWMYYSICTHLHTLNEIISMSYVQMCAKRAKNMLLYSAIVNKMALRARRGPRLCCVHRFNGKLHAEFAFGIKSGGEHKKNACKMLERHACVHPVLLWRTNVPRFIAETTCTTIVFSILYMYYTI